METYYRCLIILSNLVLPTSEISLDLWERKERSLRESSLLVVIWAVLGVQMATWHIGVSSFAQPGDPSEWRCKSMFVLCIIMLPPDGSPSWIFWKPISNSHPNECESWWCIWMQMHLFQSKMINDKNDHLKLKYYFQTVNSTFCKYIFPSEPKNIYFPQKLKTYFLAKTAKCIFPQKT